jgi:hypothetical protein
MLFQKHLRHLRLLALLAAAPLAAQAQTGSVGIGTSTPNASAALDVSSTSKGLLPPRLSTAQRDAIASPAAGLTVLNTSTGVLNTWDGAKWVAALTYTTTVVPTATSVGFAYTGGAQTYRVPMGVTVLSVDMAGAAGGDATLGFSPVLGGAGGRVQATLAVTPGQVLTIQVGGAGGSPIAGYNGGGPGSSGVGSGGGGASDVRVGGTAPTNRVLVAGGGGGAGAEGRGGAGGGLTGATGGGTTVNSIGGGGGGSQSAAGTANNGGSDGSGSTGGSGGSAPVTGGGGGGYFGGAGGGGGGGGGRGGGGSSYAGTGTSAVTHTQGYQSGNGYVTIMSVVPTSSQPAPFLDGSNFAGVIKNQTTQQVGAYFNIDGNGIIGGSLGVGTPAPTQKLEVAGQVFSSTGGFRFPNNTVQTTAATSANFIQNQLGPQASSNFNIDGNGTVGGSLTAARLRLSSTALVGGGTAPIATNATGLSWNAVNPNAGESELYNYRGLGSGGFRFFSLAGTDAPDASIDIAFINGSTGVYSNLSDRRLKTNIVPLAQGLRTVLALRPVSYDFHTSRQLENGVVTFLPDDKPVRALGFVAQDLYQVVPEAVERPADERRAFYTVSYATLVPVLTQAIQEQQAQIEELKKQNAALQARAATAEAQAAQATAMLETFEARLRRPAGRPSGNFQ